MTLSEWLEYGIKQGFCSNVVCSTHDGLPPTNEEMMIEDQDGWLDACIPAVRLYAD